MNISVICMMSLTVISLVLFVRLAKASEKLKKYEGAVDEIETVCKKAK